MDNLYVRSVFFVKDAERSLRYYTETLGFGLNWTHKEQGRAYVFQVSLLGFELILNQTESPTDSRAGQGRVFIAVGHDQTEKIRQHIRNKNIKITVTHWGNPTLVIQDLDQNELFMWLPEGELARFEAEFGA